MQKGQKVTVINCEDKQLPMRVAGLVGDIILVCNDEEFKLAEEENREPRSVGFKKQWVIENFLGSATQI